MELVDAHVAATAAHLNGPNMDLSRTFPAPRFSKEHDLRMVGFKHLYFKKMVRDWEKHEKRQHVDFNWMGSKDGNY